MITRKPKYGSQRQGYRSLVLVTIALVAALACGTVCIGADCEDKHLAKLPEEYVSQQQRYGFAVVYSECAEPHGKAVLLYPLSNYDPFGVLPGQVVNFDRHKIEWAGIGVLFHFVRGCLTEDVATLRIGTHGLLIADDGGIYEINQSGKLARALSRWPFHFLPPDQVADFLGSVPSESCPAPDKQR